MRIHILYSFTDKPWGGGNQFLKGLKSYLKSLDAYTDSIESADVVLFNSHHSLGDVFWARLRWPRKIFIHRVDGPIYLIRGRDKQIDSLVYKANEVLSDATVYQSEWSRSQCIEQGMVLHGQSAVIHNSPDTSIFYKRQNSGLNVFNRKFRVIATSWSNNWKKGFDVYKYLEENMDFSSFDFTFVGNSPIKFRNIRHLPPLPSALLADELRKHDAYLTASLDDPCSNSLIEALSCGLPAIVRNSGGHQELIGNAGVVFNDASDVCNAIHSLKSEYSKFETNASGFDVCGAFQKYLAFVSSVSIYKSKNSRCLPIYGIYEVFLAYSNVKLQSLMQKLSAT